MSTQADRVLTKDDMERIALSFVINLDHEVNAETSAEIGALALVKQDAKSYAAGVADTEARYAKLVELWREWCKLPFYTEYDAYDKYFLSFKDEVIKALRQLKERP